MQYLTLREKIAKQIRDAIIKGEYKSGERIPEPELATKYGFSRTPVREALRQLESEGIVVVNPRKGAIVAPITSRDIREFYELKGILEGKAGAMALTNMKEIDIDKMEALNENLKRSFEEKDFVKALKYHNQFHAAFQKKCTNNLLVETIEQLNIKFQKFRIALSHVGDFEVIISQHEDIIAAFRQKDIPRIERAIYDNAVYGSDTLVHHLEEEKPKKR